MSGGVWAKPGVSKARIGGSVNLYLGVDAGGTASKSRLTDAHGKVLGSGKAGPANTRIGLDELHSTLLHVCTQAINAAGLNEAEIKTLRCGMGIAGINRMGMKPQIQALPFPLPMCNSPATQ